MRRSSLFLPVPFALALFFLHWFVRHNPRLLDDLRLERGPVLSFILFLAWVPIIMIAVRAIDLLAFDLLVSRRRNVRAPVLLREIISIALYAILLAWAITAIFGSGKITAVLATGTVVAAVLGLALQETLGNLFAGIALHLEDSFELGDVVHSGDYIGVVEAVRWRGTRIRTFNNNIVIVPNSALARERLEVFPRNNLNARILQIGIDYNIAPAVVISVLTQAASNVEGVSREMPCIARVGGFADSSVMYEVKYYTSDYSMRDRIDADIRRAVWYALRRNNISIPYPIRAVRRYETPQGMHHPGASDVLARLAEVDIFSPLPPEVQEAIAAAARVHVFSKGETIIRRGTAGDSMFIVHEGTVSVRVPEEEGHGVREVARLQPGEFFGEMALLTGENRTADVVAATDVATVEIAKNALQPVLHDHPDLAAVISAKVTERRGRLDSMRSEVHDEAPESVLSRIRAYFGL